MALFFFSCKNETKTENKISVSRIQSVAEISFRRSYVDHQNLSKEALRELYKSNPSLENYDEFNQNQKLFKELEKLKILKGDKNNQMLLLKRFEDIYSKDVKYLDPQKKISFNYLSDFSKSNSIDIKILKNNEVTEKKIDFGSDNFLGMILEDIDNDGIKEILILLNFYVMNGDNYILKIYKFVE